MKIAILGAGGWGTAIGIVLAGKDLEVYLAPRRREFANNLLRNRENRDYLPGVPLPNNLIIAGDYAEAVLAAQVVIFATPSKAIRETALLLKGVIAPTALVVSLAKGLEKGTFMRNSEILGQVLDNPHRVVALSGPNHAEEVARGVPSATVAASIDLNSAKMAQDLFMTPSFRVYSNPDIIGVEIAGALKNIIALAAGICDGLGYGDNTKAALMTRGLTEIARLGLTQGADSLTFAGLAGVGDLIATCTSKHSRNWRTGYALGRGQTLESILRVSGVVVEGVNATTVASSLASALQVEMPITNALKKVIDGTISPVDAVKSLMVRAKTHETEEVAAPRNWFSQ
jgi:glycerol-3-phosphate dehydrogenase (NAD(P)+)